MPDLYPSDLGQESSVEICARSCDIASMDAVQQLALQLKEMPRVAGAARGWADGFLNGDFHGT